MKHRFPLYLKIVLWFLLNLAILGVAAIVFLGGKFGLDLLLSGPVTQRIGGVTEAITSELRARPEPEWSGVLESRSASYGVRFVLFEDDGTQLAGESTILPAEVRQRMKGPGDRRSNMRGFTRFEEQRPGGSTNYLPFRPRPRFVIRTANPTQYWIGMPAFLGAREEHLPRFCNLVIISKNLYGGGLFFDAKPWLAAGACVLVFSVLFWFPLVRGITRSLAAMTRATEQIAEGRFDVRVSIPRRDELGQLGTAVNRMAERLEGFVTGQKRFLGDTAHELCTPLARIQMAVGILEQRADQAAQAYVQDVRDEVQHMSELVAELLSFSKASLARAEVKLQPVNLREVTTQAIQREAHAGIDIENTIDPQIQALGAPDLLQRAVANLLRNAIRYAGSNGPIKVCASSQNGEIELIVSDSGPGVPEELLPRLCDPFFRVDDARTRETGGVGLGLTIVRTCVEACGGTVTCRNRKPTGLEVTLRLKGIDSRPQEGVARSAPPEGGPAAAALIQNKG